MHYVDAAMNVHTYDMSQDEIDLSVYPRFKIRVTINNKVKRRLGTIVFLSIAQWSDSG